MKRTTLLALVIALITGLGAVAAYRLYTQEVPSLADEEAAASLSVEAILAAYSEDEAQANELYLDQVVEVYGSVKEAPTQRDSTTIVLLGDPAEMASVSCAFGPEEASAAAELKPGESVTIKGLCTGSLLDVNLARCVLVSE